MDLDGLVVRRESPQSRAKKTVGPREHHFYEGAVMLAYAMHLLHTEDTCEASVHPDGQHNRQFPFTGWLGQQGFTKVKPVGTTAYGGDYQNSSGQTITVNPKSGLGDVVAKIGTRDLLAECKGGVINSRHAGQQSRLRRGLCEAVGLLMSKQSKGRQIAVVPKTDTTSRIAKDLASRCASAGIEIVLVGERGEIHHVKPWEGTSGTP